MPNTLVEKILARAAGLPEVRPGQIVTCKVDFAVMHDSAGPRRVGPRLRELGIWIWDPSKVVLVSDHYVPAVDLESAQILKGARDWAAEQGIKHYDAKGIIHIMVAEGGHLRPGMFAAGGDSHSPSGGAFGCYMAGFGATDMTRVMATGEIWTRVPETMLVTVKGTPGPGISAKDVILHLCGLIGSDNAFKVIEYAGPGIAAMSMAERMVLTNMAAELGAETAIIAADQTTLDAIRAAGGEVDDAAIGLWQSDADAAYERRIEIDLGALQPQVAYPHSPENTRIVPASDAPKIDQAYIGACVGAKLEDLQMAAKVLRGRKIAPTVRLLVAPASLEINRRAMADGTMQALVDAGATMLPTGCGACAGYGAGILAAGEVCISTTNRNFRGRMGHKDSEVYLASPYTVAASAIAGHIADPRPFLSGAAL